MYSPDTNGIKRIQAHDETFNAVYRLDHLEPGAARPFLMRNEYPREHFCEFTRADTIDKLTARGQPPALHEVVDGRRPFRLCFDIDHTVNVEYTDEFFEEYNQRRQSDEDLEALLTGRAPVTLPVVQPTPELFYSAKVIPQRDEYARVIQTNLVDAINSIFLDADYPARKFYRMDAALNLTEEAPEPFIRAADIMLFDASAISPRVVAGVIKPPKLSFHVICSALFVVNADEGKLITRLIIDKLAQNPETSELAGHIDRGVIKNRFFLRIPGAAKLDEPGRILQAYGAATRTKAAEFTHALVQQGVQNIHAAVCVDSGITVAPEIRAANGAGSPETIARIIARYPDYFAGYAFRGCSMNFVHFTRVGETPQCVFCARTHTIENAVYLMIKGDRVYLKCRRMPSDQPHGIELFAEDPETAEIPREVDFPAHMQAMKIVQADSYPSRTIKINREFIEDEITTQIDAGRRTILIRSPMGSGKTYALKAAIEHLEMMPQNVFMLSFRRAFTLEKAAQLNFDHYLNYPNEVLPDEPRRFICQYESLYRMHPDFRPSVLLVDEIESINEQIQSFQNNGGLALEALARFQQYVREAAYVIVMDANLSKSSAGYFLRLRAADAPVIIVNEFKRDREITAYPFENALTDAIRERAKVSRVGVCSDSRTYLQALEKMLQADGIPAEEIKVVTSDNAQEFQREITEAGSISELVKRYRVFGYNTTLLAGISIEDAELSDQFACFTENFITPTGAFQLIGRIRAMTRLGIFIGKQNVTPVTFDQEIARTFCLKSMSFADMLRVGRKLSPLPRMLARHRVTMNNARARLLESTLALWHDTGARIIMAPRTAPKSSARAHFGEMRDLRAGKIAAANSYADDSFGKKLNDLIITYNLGTVIGGDSKVKLPAETIKLMQKKANVTAWKTLTELNGTGSFRQLGEKAAEQLASVPRNNGMVAQANLATNEHASGVITALGVLEAFGVNMDGTAITSARLNHDDYSAIIMRLSGETDVKYAARKLNTLLARTFGAKITSTARTRKGYDGYCIKAHGDLFEWSESWHVRFMLEHTRAQVLEAENVQRVDPIE